MIRWILPALFCLLTPWTARGQSDGASSTDYTPIERGHWSLLPRATPQIPTFASADDRQWVRNPVDAFILKSLQREGLRPAPEASRVVLIRRLTFDLTGLPPTPAEIAQFLKDQSPTAYETLVERLLASPHYGERWGQHWLDVVRYAETEGFEYDRTRPDAWRFRDYVIRALNQDKPFDQFIREQLAGDELGADDAELQIAAGFHRLGPIRRNAGNAEVSFSRNEVLTEMTDAIGFAFLGMTIGCARCHDHKFDPIRQRDYYSLQAFLAATHEFDIPLASNEEQARFRTRSDRVNAEIARLKEAIKDAQGDTKQQLEQQLAEAESRIPLPLACISSVQNLQEQRTPIHLLTRGDETKKGEPLPMRFPGVFFDGVAPEIPASAANPKTALANWIVSPDHPLTTRVLANRVWQYHFGQGIVATPNDFGVNGAEPSHPELLDYLANALISGNWRLKALHRLIVTSNTYRQSSQVKPGQLASVRDPSNRWLWRFPRRRLEAEELRDAMLLVSGMLNPKREGPSVITPVEQELVDLLYKPAQWTVTSDPREHARRSIYLIAKRNLKLPFMEVFDQPDLQTSCPQRQASTHAPQALELLNGRVANELADAFAERLQREAGPEPADRVRLAFFLACGREPSALEHQVAADFLARQPLREFAVAMFNLNAFIYVE